MVLKYSLLLFTCVFFTQKNFCTSFLLTPQEVVHKNLNETSKIVKSWLFLSDRRQIIDSQEIFDYTTSIRFSSNNIDSIKSLTLHHITITKTSNTDTTKDFFNIVLNSYQVTRMKNIIFKRPLGLSRQVKNDIDHRQIKLNIEDDIKSDKLIQIISSEHSEQFEQTAPFISTIKRSVPVHKSQPETVLLMSHQFQDKSWNYKFIDKVERNSEVYLRLSELQQRTESRQVRIENCQESIIKILGIKHVVRKGIKSKKDWCFFTGNSFINKYDLFNFRESHTYQIPIINKYFDQYYSYLWLQSPNQSYTIETLGTSIFPPNTVSFPNIAERLELELYNGSDALASSSIVSPLNLNYFYPDCISPKRRSNYSYLKTNWGLSSLAKVKNPNLQVSINVFFDALGENNAYHFPYLPPEISEISQSIQDLEEIMRFSSRPKSITLTKFSKFQDLPDYLESLYYSSGSERDYYSKNFQREGYIIRNTKYINK